MLIRHWSTWVCLLGGLVQTVTLASDRPKQEFWDGKLADKTKSVSFETAGKPAEIKASSLSQTIAPAQTQPHGGDVQSVPREPEWLRRMDKNDRATLTGGWGLQNLSGGTQSFTTPGDKSGQYAPNLYQGQQFLQWHNLATRSETARWNGSYQTYPHSMWSQGYVSPNNYFGPAAQSWGNMSAGSMGMNQGTGGWSMQAWR